MKKRVRGNEYQRYKERYKANSAKRRADPVLRAHDLERRRRYYAANREIISAKYKKWWRDNRDILRMKAQKKADEYREFIRNFKAVPCADCGVQYPYYVMDFDHVSGKKVKAVSLMVCANLEDVFEEIQKCDVVCANCHRERTHRRKAGIKINP